MGLGERVRGWLGERVLMIIRAFAARPYVLHMLRLGCPSNGAVTWPPPCQEGTAAAARVNLDSVSLASATHNPETFSHVCAYKNYRVQLKLGYLPAEKPHAQENGREQLRLERQACTACSGNTV